MKYLSHTMTKKGCNNIADRKWANITHIHKRKLSTCRPTYGTTTERLEEHMESCK